MDDVTTDEAIRAVTTGANLVTVVDAATLNTMQVYLQGVGGAAGANNVLAEDTVSGSTTTRWALTDYQGTVRDVVDSSGNLIDHLVYSSFGNIVSQSDSTNAIRITYANLAYDPESGYYYDNARYYDSFNGRFISQDPTGFAAGDTDLYRYVGDNPINMVDPTGLLTQATAEDVVRDFLLTFNNPITIENGDNDGIIDRIMSR